MFSLEYFWPLSGIFSLVYSKYFQKFCQNFILSVRKKFFVGNFLCGKIFLIFHGSRKFSIKILEYWAKKLLKCRKSILLVQSVFLRFFYRFERFSSATFLDFDLCFAAACSDFSRRFVETYSTCPEGSFCQKRSPRNFILKILKILGLSLAEMLSNDFYPSQQVVETATAFEAWKLKF